jgi:hypothetical protein
MNQSTTAMKTNKGMNQVSKFQVLFSLFQPIKAIRDKIKRRKRKKHSGGKHINTTK